MTYQLLLYPFFEELRKELQIPLGIDNYYDLLNILRDDPLPDSLLFTCKTLWLKSHAPNDVNAFESVFKKHFEMELAVVQAALQNEKKKAAQEQKSSDDASNRILPESEKEKEENTTKNDHSAENQTPILDDWLKKEEAEKSDSTEAQINMGSQTQQIAVNINGKEDDKSDISQHRFLLGKEYLPIHPRDIQQNWRFLQYNRRNGLSPEIDFSLTIEHIAKKGIFEHPVYRPRRKNTVKLLMLVDNSHSMSAFGTLAEEIVQNALRDPYVTDEHLYYFNNYPMEYVYRDAVGIQPESIESVLQNCNKYTLMLIISDAGAARGFVNADRIEATRRFLKSCQAAVRQIAWLNPMPHNRWDETSAEWLATSVPMFEINRHDWYKTISSLRGKKR